MNGAYYNSHGQNLSSENMVNMEWRLGWERIYSGLL